MNKCDFVSCRGTTQDRVYSRGAGPSNQSPPKTKAREDRGIQRSWVRPLGARENDPQHLKALQKRGGKELFLLIFFLLSLIFFPLREYGNIAVSILSQG